MQKLIHSIPLREPAAVKVEVLPDDRIRIGLHRDDVLVAGFALNAADVRELRAALGLALAEVDLRTETADRFIDALVDGERVA